MRKGVIPWDIVTMSIWTADKTPQHIGQLERKEYDL